jgi:hypothetical protein
MGEDVAVGVLTSEPSWPSLQRQEGWDEVVILPVQIDQGRGIYRSETDTLGKTLRVEGAEASYAHANEDRSWQSLKGAVELTFVLSILASVIGAASWDAIKAGFRRWARTLEPDQTIRLDVRVDGDEKGTRTWIQLSGDAVGVADALDRLPPLLKPDNEADATDE